VKCARCRAHTSAKISRRIEAEANSIHIVHGRSRQPGAGFGKGLIHMSTIEKLKMAVREKDNRKWTWRCPGEVEQDSSKIHHDSAQSTTAARRALVRGYQGDESIFTAKRSGTGLSKDTTSLAQAVRLPGSGAVAERTFSSKQNSGLSMPNMDIAWKTELPQIIGSHREMEKCPFVEAG
jgi:hypothetical protein